MSTMCGSAIFGQTLLGHIGIHTHILTLFAVCAGLSGYIAYKDIQLSAKKMLLLGMIIWAQHGFALDMPQLTLEGATYPLLQ